MYLSFSKCFLKCGKILEIYFSVHYNTMLIFPCTAYLKWKNENDHKDKVQKNCNCKINVYSYFAIIV